MLSQQNDGHRKRLKERFLASTDAICDYEILELLLFYVFKRKDTKVYAKNLLKHFKSLKKVFNADVEDLHELEGVGESSVLLIKLVHEICARILLESVEDEIIINSTESVIKFYKHKLAEAKNEELRVMFLNNKNRLIKEKQLQAGTVNATPIYPRKIVEEALRYAASAIIMIHNHPSGDPKPSKNDIIMTNETKKATASVGILLLDHLIIGKGKYYSFAEHQG